MLRYEYVNKEWIVSPTARIVYRAAAIVSLTLFPSLMALLLLDPVRPFLKPFIFFAVLGTAVNALGMEYFLFRFDDSHALKQVFWFCAMIFIPIGPALYYFIVYSRSDILKSSFEDRPDRK
jgi:hypothetical protein